MSKPTIISAQCPHCNADIEIPYYEDVNVTTDPVLKKAILSGDFFKYICPSCGESLPIVGPLLYHDQNAAAMFYFCPPGFDQSTEKLNEMLQVIEGIEGSRASYYQARLVSSIDKLMEKIYILDAGLDDRIVELVKLAYLKHYSADLQSKGRIRATLFMPSLEDEEAQIVFMLGDDGDMATVDFSKDYYAFFGTEYAQRLGNHTEPHFETIDEKWAAQFVSNQNYGGLNR